MLDVRRFDCKSWYMVDSSMVDFPDPEQANDDGLLAAGGDLSAQTIIHAYRHGIFPWYEADGPILWWSPDPRMVLFPDAFHCSRRLARRIRQGHFTVTMDKGFAAVMHACADRPEGTWIHAEMMSAYQHLFDLGVAHSIEVWLQGELVGGLYGLRIGRIFFAESMFSRLTDTSKIALAHLVQIAGEQAWTMIDCQFYTGHLHRMGAVEISRVEFLRHLDAAI
ncbi:MAG: leucyl/phenylalanyl-tRNA--protein transferase [Mariprofundaceae bacterium]